MRLLLRECSLIFKRDLKVCEKQPFILLYEEAVEVLLHSRKISVQEGDVTDGEDLDLARCYVALKDKENAEKYLDLAREGLENVPEEHADEFEATLEEIEDLIEKL